MKKLFCIIFVLIMLFPTIAMADTVSINNEIKTDVILIDNDDPNYRLSIWIPKDYTSKKKYDIFMFLQGGGENLNFAEVTATEHDGILISDIYEKINADFIVVGIQCGTDFDEITGRMFYAMGYAADHYSTYAKSGKLEDLKAARDHIIVGGISNGGRVATYFITYYNEYVSNAIIMSPTIWRRPPEGFNLNHFIVCIGDNDNKPCIPAAEESYKQLSPYANKSYYSVYHGRHQWKYWNCQLEMALNFVYDEGEFATTTKKISNLINNLPGFLTIKRFLNYENFKVY